MSKAEEFWSYWLHWWEHIAGLTIKDNPVLEEYIILWFPSNTDAKQIVQSIQNV